MFLGHDNKDKVFISHFRVFIPLKSSRFKIFKDKNSWIEYNRMDDHYWLYFNKENLDIKYFKLEFLNKESKR